MTVSAPMRLSERVIAYVVSNGPISTMDVVKEFYGDDYGPGHTRIYRLLRQAEKYGIVRRKVIREIDGYSNRKAIWEGAADA